MNIGGGSHTVGNFLSVSGMRTDRFLDPPEFEALHDHGDSVSFFDRLDAHAGATSTFHLNVQGARSSFDVPNTFDQNDLGQDQHQKINTFNVAPGYSQVIGGATLFTANAFVRQDHLTYTPSADPFADQPGSVSQDRKLTNIGVKADVAHTIGAHNVKFGGTIGATKLDEEFHHRHHRSGLQRRLTVRTSTRIWLPVRSDARRVAARSTPRRRRSSSRRPTSRTTSRPAMPASSSACGSITTTA